VLKGTDEIWSARLLASNGPTSSHDVTVAVRKGDEIAFIVHKLEPAKQADGSGLDVLANNGPVLPNTRGGTPLKIGTKEFVRGLFCHAVSKVVVRLPNHGKTFSAIVGVDANNDPGVKGSVVFSVSVAGKAVFKSEVLKGKMEGVPVNVALGDAGEFVLEAGDAGDGINWDWAVWADAKVTLADGKEIWLADLPLNDSRNVQDRVLWDPVITYVEK
jgi:hypothetical protein